MVEKGTNSLLMRSKGSSATICFKCTQMPLYTKTFQMAARAEKADFSAEKSGSQRTQDLFRIRVLERQINAGPEAEFMNVQFC